MGHDTVGISDAGECVSRSTAPADVDCSVCAASWGYATQLAWAELLGIGIGMVSIFV